MKVAMLQTDVQPGDPEANWTRVRPLLEEAVASKAHVLLLPELWSVGYVWREGPEYLGARELSSLSHSLAEDPMLERIEQMARYAGVWIIAGSLPEASPAGIFNTTVVVNPSGEQVHCYRKLHLIGLMEEPEHMIAGTEAEIFSLDGVPAGAMICYDIRFPELARQLTLSGAQILFVSAQWPSPRIEHWRTLLRARAIENQCFVVACNRVGRSGADLFPGASLVIGPWGEILAEGGEEECVITAELELQQMEALRRSFPSLQDVRHGMYHRLG